MISLVAFCGGVGVGAVVLYFVARNNKEKAIKYLTKDLNIELDLLKSRLMDELATAKEETKAKINELLEDLKARINK